MSENKTTLGREFYEHVVAYQMLGARHRLPSWDDLPTATQEAWSQEATKPSWNWEPQNG
jgi:hypothetical protein